MTPEKQRIAIAEACGWEWHGDALWPKQSEDFYWKIQGKCCYQTTPDYLSDLNAMHEAENHLRNNQFHYVNYPDALFEVVTGCKWSGDLGYFTFCFVNATAAQRAEAFLKTIGKWEE